MRDTHITLAVIILVLCSIPIVHGQGGPLPVKKLERKSLYAQINEKKDEFNEFIETSGIPRPFQKFATGRFIIHVDGETIGVILKDGKILEVKRGPIANPTSEIWTTREFILDVYTSDAPIKMIVSGMKSGEIRKKDYGAANKLRGALVSTALKLGDIAGSKKVALRRQRVLARIADIAISPKKGFYVISPSTTKLRRTHIEIKAKRGRDISKNEIKITEYSGYSIGKSPLGLKKWETARGEISLGTFVSVEAPREAIDWTLLLLKYSEKELADRGLLEDWLYVKWYDDDPTSDTYGEWITLSKGNPPWVNSIGINKRKNIIWVNTSHLSVFGVGGRIESHAISEIVDIKAPIVGPPPSPLPEKPPETLAPVEPLIEEPENRGILAVGIVVVVLALIGVIIKIKRK
jgi:hypothetical protein